VARNMAEMDLAARYGRLYRVYRNDNKASIHLKICDNFAKQRNEGSREASIEGSRFAK